MTATLSPDAREALLAQMVAAARDAGALIMRHYAGEIVRREKADKSPVTLADEEAEYLIIRDLAKAAPAIPVVAEESAAAGAKPDVSGGVFFLVDPLDGTKEFLNHNGEFTVNIALIEHGRPTAGVVFAPAIGRMFWGCNAKAFEEHGKTPARQIKTRETPPDGMTAIASRSHRDRLTEEYLAHYPIRDLIAAGSSLKFCVIAAGEADLYPRHGTTSLTYGNARENFTNPSFVAWGR